MMKTHTTTIPVESPEPPAWVKRYPEAVERWYNDLAWRVNAVDATTNKQMRRSVLRSAGVILPATSQHYDHLRAFARRGCNEREFWAEVRRLNADEVIAADIFHDAR